MESGGAISVNGPLELESTLNLLFNNKEVLNKISVAAKEFVYKNKGATKKIIDHIQRNRLLIN